MSRYANPIVVAIALFIGSAAAAADYSDLYVIPVAGHTPGANGTAWRSDLVLHNLQLVPITVEVAFIETGKAATSDVIAIPSLQLLPGETRLVPDILGQQARDMTGALIVGATMPFVVTSRTYAERPGGRTLGQTVVPVAISGGPDATNEVAVLAALEQNERRRANVGLFLVASRAPFMAEIELRSSSGQLLGSHNIVLDATGFAHQQLSVNAIAAGVSETVSATVRVVQGDGIVVPYGAIIDNESAEAIFVSADAATNQSASAGTMLRRIVAMSQ